MTITTKGQRSNPFFDYLRNSGMSEEKHIPMSYKTSSREERLQLAAGILDADGYLDKDRRSFELACSDIRLVNDYAYLFRSLGYRFTVKARKKKYKSFTRGKLYEGVADTHVCYLAGDNLNEIPTVLNRKQALATDKRVYQDLAAITVEKLKVGDYYGFTLDGNHRYLLSDFTVTHNTSITFGILNSTSLDGIRSMFFSLDMAAPQVYQRLAQRHTGLHSDVIFNAYQSGDKGVIERVEKELSTNYANVKFCFKGAMNVDIIRDAILKEKQLTGEFPKLVVIDYLENIMCDMSNDPTISKGFIARALKDIANEFAICILLLVQPAKVSGGPSQELNSYYGIKGSSVVAEAASQVFTMHRPGFSPKNPEDDNYLTITVVKNRMGQLGTFDFHWTGITGAIRELSSEEVGHLAQVRKANSEEKEDLI